jgi:deoxyribodipyrimidine photo-lyase
MTAVQSMVPDSRIRVDNSEAVNPEGRWVIYWMIAARRTRFNFGLERAADWARQLGRPLVVLEALRCDYPWASDRLHRFVIQGMVDNSEALQRTNAVYHPYVEPQMGAGKGLLDALADSATVIVTDDFPTFFLPRMVRAAAQRLAVRLECVDSNGLLPMAAADRDFATAYSFRRHLQRTLIDHVEEVPLEDPLYDLPAAGALPSAITERWPAANLGGLADDPGAMARLPIDHTVSVVSDTGGSRTAEIVLRRFLDKKLDRYSGERNRPEDDVGSNLSPYLHFGHISSHQVFLELMTRAGWSPENVVGPTNGRRAGWWGVDPHTEAFLDQLVTWRELGFNFCHYRPDHARWESLPDWARHTLEFHAGDPRDHLYDLGEFVGAQTHDPLWNAAQNQLVREGRIHNYLRMLWGKKILEWTENPRRALEIMIELNNRYALDGRDPNSYTGIFWVLGRHDRAWGPERPVFGKVRYMSSANTARKVPVRRYMERFA